MDTLLLHPSNRLQLGVISRIDPPFSLGLLRAHNSVVEIRMRDLQFTLTETRNFLQLATGKTISGAALAYLQEITEGWVTGLRLASLALRHHSDTDAFLRGLSGD